MDMPVDYAHVREFPREQIGEHRRAAIPAPDRVKCRELLFYPALHTDGDFRLFAHNTILLQDRTSVQ